LHDVPQPGSGSNPENSGTKECRRRYQASVSLGPNAHGRGAAPPGLSDCQFWPGSKRGDVGIAPFAGPPRLGAWPVPSLHPPTIPRSSYAALVGWENGPDHRRATWHGPVGFLRMPPSETAHAGSRPTTGRPYRSPSEARRHAGLVSCHWGKLLWGICSFCVPTWPG